MSAALSSAPLREGGADQTVEAIIRLARSVTYSDLSEIERQGARRVLLDSLGCALGAFDDPAPRIARRLAAGAQGSRPCTLIGDPRQTHGDFAAFANGVMVRYLDFNDTYASPHGVGHPSDYIAAVLAAAEEAGAGGSAVVEGIAVVYELFAALTDATKLGVEGFDHVLAGDVASAVAVGVVWEFDDDQLRQAVSLSLVPNFGLQATRLGELSMWKGCASANACRNGLFAARLAREGLTGPSQPFGGRAGFEAVLGTKIDAAALQVTGGTRAVGRSDLKRYPAGYFSQGAIDAALELRAQLEGDGPIATVEIGTFEYGSRVMAGDPEKWRPQTRESADHSIPYVVATALVHGDLDVGRFSEQALHDPEVARVLGGLTVHEDPECAAAWPGAVMTKMRVTTASGRQVSTRVRHYRGHALNPMSDSEVEEKARRLSADALSDRQFQELVDAVWSLDRIATVEELLRLTHPR